MNVKLGKSCLVEQVLYSIQRSISQAVEFSPNLRLIVANALITVCYPLWILNLQRSFREYSNTRLMLFRLTLFQYYALVL